MPNKYTIKYVLVFFSILFLTSVVQAETPVSFFGTVEPGTTQALLNTGLIGSEQTSGEDLNELLRPDGEFSLRITSVYVILVPRRGIPNADDYARVGVAEISPSGSVRGFGTSTFTVNGPETMQLNFEPGLYVELSRRNSLGLTSLVQSNQTARISIHGFLDKKLPEKL